MEPLALLLIVATGQARSPMVEAIQATVTSVEEVTLLVREAQADISDDEIDDARKEARANAAVLLSRVADRHCRNRILLRTGIPTSDGRLVWSRKELRFCANDSATEIGRAVGLVLATEISGRLPTSAPEPRGSLGARDAPRAAETPPPSAVVASRAPEPRASLAASLPVGSSAEHARAKRTQRTPVTPPPAHKLTPAQARQLAKLIDLLLDTRPAARSESIDDVRNQLRETP